MREKQYRYLMTYAPANRYQAMATKVMKVLIVLTMAMSMNKTPIWSMHPLAQHHSKSLFAR